MGKRGPKKQFTESYYERNKQKQKDYYEQNKTIRQKYGRTYYERNRNKVLISAAKQRANQKGLDFDLTEDWLVVPEVCPVLNIPLGPPSIDRVDNSKGYIQDNCRVISKRANRLKSDMTLEECEAILRYMKSS